MATRNEVLDFYRTNFDVLGQWKLQPGQKVVLGDKKAPRVCRFCGKGKPEVTFRKVAHAIPELIGNKSIESAYECDPCNQAFGSGIENDLGNWSKPMRTFARIRGKNGVPTLKRGADGQGWRIEYDGASGFRITSYEKDPFFSVDEAKNKVSFKLARDPYTPVAVLKAFMKIGLTLLPPEEIGNFEHAIAWVRDPDHSIPFADKCPIMYHFQPGPMPDDVITASILRRKPEVTDQAYCYLVLSYGNEAFQVQIPSKEHDGSSQTYSVYPYPPPGSPDPERFGPPGRALLDMTDRNVRKGESFPVKCGFEAAVREIASPRKS